MILDVKNVTWQRDETTILKDISWQVHKNEHWCLVGLNGSGKTSLLKIICGYTWPTSGEVNVLGNLYGTVDLREVRKTIGWVSTALIAQLHDHETAYRIVLSGREATIGLYSVPSAEDKKKAEDLLNTFGCEALKNRPFSALSQGERQKVLIARALMASPKLLILDEPCTGLDLLSREQLLAMIEQIAAQPDGPTLLYVTHHIEEILPCFTHTLLLKEGAVDQVGPSQEVLTANRLTQFFGVPVNVQRSQGRAWISLGEEASVR
ncbi:ABC transporter ATP-binding protein [Brevibacillus reuszeri]|uniref:ABC transporter ATP-binding protein n=1 Tax=Brevibacillus reuszeri TaxID=54915 RepID=A0A0K9YRU8_9BACL|nr:ABC transporter ATP-binding protein [Brevibacillus reuszeri]KNB71352.1 molybdenum ABC transporter ATP-binding protein [Brevibacillus reuszeri]MED1857799.1 ABC transporter ATP-binding protein [Brevibacillus reuszeri]GED66370.1 ABC transporter ATP-binding protein [Brevibacillus reuszeri]